MKIISLSFSKDYMDLRLLRPFLGKISALFTGSQSSFPNNVFSPTPRDFRPFPDHCTISELCLKSHMGGIMCSQHVLYVCYACACTQVYVLPTACVLRSEDNFSCCFGLLPCLKSHTLSCSLLHTLG